MRMKVAETNNDSLRAQWIWILFLIDIDQYLKIAGKIQLQPLCPPSSCFSLSKFLRCDRIRIDEIDISQIEYYGLYN